MPPSAPLRVPVELRRADADGRGDRCFRLAQEVSLDGLELFGAAVPHAFDGPLTLRFHLPEDPLPVIALGRAIEVAPPDDDEARGAELLALRFIQLDDEPRARIARYIEERTLIP